TVAAGSKGVNRGRRSTARIPYDCGTPWARPIIGDGVPSRASTRANATFPQDEVESMDPAWFQGLRWRCIGPPRGGRVVAVGGHPTEPMVFYFGAVAGGVWKTTDGGTYWENVSDGYFRTSAIGALAVAESDPNVVYAGTGEATIRIDVVYGDGVYKTTDGGKTWAHAGLADTRHIGKIQVHPQDPDLVYAAALGHAFGPNHER